MAKYVHSVSLKGVLDVLNMEVEESSKDSVETFDLREILQTFEGQMVSISIKQEELVIPTEEQEVEV